MQIATITLLIAVVNLAGCQQKNSFESCVEYWTNHYRTTQEGLMRNAPESLRRELTVRTISDNCKVGN